MDIIGNIAGEILGKWYEFITYLSNCSKDGNGIKFTLGLTAIIAISCGVTSLIKKIKEG